MLCLPCGALPCGALADVCVLHAWTRWRATAASPDDPRQPHPGDAAQPGAGRGSRLCRAACLEGVPVHSSAAAVGHPEQLGIKNKARMCHERTLPRPAAVRLIRSCSLVGRKWIPGRSAAVQHTVANRVALQLSQTSPPHVLPRLRQHLSSRLSSASPPCRPRKLGVAQQFRQRLVKGLVEPLQRYHRRLAQQRVPPLASFQRRRLQR